MLAHVSPDGGLAAGVAFLFDEPVVDAPTGVMLLGRTELVPGQPLVYDGDVWAEYRPRAWLGKLVAGRTSIPDGCSDCTPVMVTLPGNLAYTFAFNEEGPANLFFLVHVKHSFPPVSEVSSSLPDFPDPVGVFSPVTLPSGVGAFYPSIYTLYKAYKQLPVGTQPCFIILCSSTGFPIESHAMLNALIGTLAYRVYLRTSSTGKVPDSEPFRQPNGFFQATRNRKLSIVGLYTEKLTESAMETNLEIYHNPFTINPVPDSIFMKDGIRQLVKASDTEMKWMEQ